MALERDIFSELTGVSRLLSRLRDYRQRESLSPEEWCLGMVAFAIAEADQPELPGEEFPPLYAQFEKKATLARSSTLRRVGFSPSARRSGLYPCCYHGPASAGNSLYRRPCTRATFADAKAALCRYCKWASRPCRSASASNPHSAA